MTFEELMDIVIGEKVTYIDCSYIHEAKIIYRYEYAEGSETGDQIITLDDIISSEKLY